jgi:lysophospholipase L1-like esterase
MDIYANSDGSPNISAVGAWLGGATQATVDILYDQSGNGYNATQTTAAARPFFTLTNPINGIYGITFDQNQNNGTLSLPSSLTGSGRSVTIVDIASFESSNAAVISMLGAAWTTAGSLSVLLGQGSKAALQVLTNSAFESVAATHARSQPQVTVVASGASNIVTYQDNIAQTLAVNTAGSWVGGVIGGGGTLGSGYYFGGEFYGQIIYPAQLTANDVAALTQPLNQAFDILSNPTAQLIEIGNSITQGTKGTLNFNNLRQTEPNLNRRIAILNQGVFGQTVASQFSILSSFEAQYNASLQYNLAVVGEPTNDIGNAASGSIVGVGTTSWSSYVLPMIQGMQAAKFTILVPTVLPRVWSGSATDISQREAERLAYNALVRANAGVYGYTVIDYAAIPQLQTPSSTAYFNDGTHPNATGYSFMAIVHAAAINAILDGQSTAPVTTTSFVGANGYESLGTKFTTSGCAVSATTGGPTAGSYTSGTAGTCTTVITMNGATGLAAPNGWACSASDRTTPTDVIAQTASTTTTATLSGTTSSGDVIGFSCMGY